MSESELKVGDVVALKSGGPKMTIVYIEPDQVRTCWFDGPHPMRDCFNPLTLDVYQDEAAPSAEPTIIGDLTSCWPTAS
jgi:uncharacterized protein YodC (DUF2158 family)